jgi:hypothetical protein
MRARSPATSIASRHTPAALRKDLSLGFQSIAVDVMFPMLKLTTAVTAFHAAFPLAPLRLYAETLGALMQALLDGPGELAKHIQLVLTDRSTPSKGQDLGVLSPRSWRLADIGAKHAFLRAVYRTDAPPGIAARSFLDRLKQGPGIATKSVRGGKSRKRRDDRLLASSS